MTLLDMANFVCSKVNQTEAEDVLACKGFLQRRFEMLWSDQLWKDSLFEYTQTLSSSGYLVTSTWLPVKKILLLPTAITRVVAVRTNTRKLDVERSETFYRSDFDSFAGQGATAQYRLLPPVVWEMDVVQAVRFYAGDDTGTAMVLTYLASDGVTITRWNDVLQGYNTFNFSRVDRWSKAASAGAITTINFSDDGFGFGSSVISLGAAETNALTRQRIHLLGTVPEGAVIRVLGKTKAPLFTADGDEPGLTGVENCLLAFVQGDMLQRERQYGKAQALQQEGALLLEQLKGQEVVQQSHNQRIVPEGGYGCPELDSFGGFSF